MNKIRNHWILANTLALLIGYSLYTPIAHGFTGGHDRQMTTDQLIAHCIALAVVGLIVFFSQRIVLKHYLNISLLRVLFSTVLFIAFFWFGYYQTIIPDGPDYDILFAYFILGCSLWIGKIPWKGNQVRTILAILIFPLASIVGEVIFLLFVIGFNIELDMQNGLLHHTLFWLTVGVTTGLLGGWLSSRVLFNMLELKETG